MRRRHAFAVPLLVLFLVGARGRAVHQPVFTALDARPVDHYTYSKPDEIEVRHADLDLTVDFDATRLHGRATLELFNKTGTRRLDLDTSDLTIEKVTLDGGRDATWSLGEDTSIGAPLTIAIEPSTRFVTIDYTTSSGASGLFWNTAEQSYGRTRPYLYSQNEAIDARSWMPLQDTPSVRLTYDATVRVPQGMLALMSAENPTSANGTGVYRFHMPYPIPSYLIALAVGRLEFRALDERTGVYAEPELIEDAAWELQPIPDMVDAGERIAGPYPFGRYDVLLMPPTYVVGGMEHPRLNFISPFSVVTGNRPAKPLASSLIAHELAHAWAGDATTLATWQDVWLNEGITSYLTERILEEVSGADRAEYDFFNQRRGFAAFAGTTKDTRATLLHRDSKSGESAEYGFNSANYTKGSLFGKTLEDLLGRATFDVWLRQYFQRFAWRWVDDRNFVAFLREKGLDRPELRLDEWIYQSGLPSNVTAPATSRLYDRVNAASTAFRAGTAMSAINTSGWTDVEIDLFVQLTVPQTRPRMAEIDAVLGLSNRNTPPTSWLTNAISANYQPAMAAVERVLMRGGTNGQILTLYNTLASNPALRPTARRIFDQARGRYEITIAFQVEEILKSVGAFSEDLDAAA